MLASETIFMPRMIWSPCTVFPIPQIFGETHHSDTMPYSIMISGKGFFYAHLQTRLDVPKPLEYPDRHWRWAVSKGILTHVLSRTHYLLCHQDPLMPRWKYHLFSNRLCYRWMATYRALRLVSRVPVISLICWSRCQFSSSSKNTSSVLPSRTWQKDIRRYSYNLMRYSDSALSKQPVFYIPHSIYSF